MANKFPLIIGIITLLIIGGGVFLFSQNQPPKLSLPSSYEYFWKDGCPHCENVAKFLDSWDKKDQVKIDKFDILTDRQNQDRLVQRATYCKLNTTQLGVPFLFTPEGKCIEGDEAIIGFFKSLNF
jgi:glutaredoxin